MAFRQTSKTLTAADARRAEEASAKAAAEAEEEEYWLNKPSPIARLCYLLQLRHKKNFVVASSAALLLLGLFSLGNMLHFPAKSPSPDSSKIKPITVVVMNHARPNNIQKSSLLPTLLKNEHITEVLLLHSNPPNAFYYKHPKVKNLNATIQNDKMGLSLRFWFCAHAATNEWVIHVDDDMLVPESTLNSVIEEFAKNSHRVVGVFGRKWSYFLSLTGLITKGYNTINTKRESEVVLTKLMIMEQHICHYFHPYAPLVEFDIISNSHPHWNGEDIFMSLVANHVYATSSSGQFSVETRKAAQQGQNNYAMPWLETGDVGDAYKDTSGKIVDISGNMKGFHPFDKRWWETVKKQYAHLRFRGNLWQQAIERLAKAHRAQDILLEENNVPAIAPFEPP